AAARPPGDGGGAPVQAVSRGAAEALRAALGSGGQTGWVPGNGGDSASSWFIGHAQTSGGRRIAVAVRVEGLPSTAGADDDGGGRAAAQVATKILAEIGG
ncbi:penicillin-binding transpeptidase domain-containing protein, partial [Streptomyces sp. NPDC002491]